jgi:hypothetical protein
MTATKESNPPGAVSEAPGAVEALVATATHELRSVLMGISGCAAIAMDSKTSADARQFLEQIVESAKTGSRMPAVQIVEALDGIPDFSGRRTDINAFGNIIALRSPAERCGKRHS